MSHGLLPFYTTSLYFPHGENLLADTGVVPIGLALSPITWLWGPVTSFNVALTLGPVVSAVSMFVLLRRWVSWDSAAFVGGLFYGFSPFLIASLTKGWLDFTFLAIPPLVVACLDELLARQSRRPTPTGIALGFLVAAQFLIGSEVLLMMVIFLGIGVVLTITYVAFFNRTAIRERAATARKGLIAAGLTAAVLLILPVSYALAGPAHISGVPWDGLFASRGTSFRNFLIAAPAPIRSADASGYQGPLVSSQFLGLGLIAILMCGLVIWRHDVRLWLFGVVGFIALVFSLGTGKLDQLPWGLLAHQPLLENILPARMVIFVYFAAATMLGIVIDHTHAAVRRRLDRDPGEGTTRRRVGLHSPFPEVMATLAGLALAAVALIQPTRYLAQTIPVTTQRIVLPKWFQAVAPHLADNQHLLVFPAPFDIESAWTWQAVGRMHYTVIGTGGPWGIGFTGPDSLATAAIAGANWSNFVLPPVTPKEIAALRSALVAWRVTTAVVVDQPDLPAYDHSSWVTLTTSLMTAVTGRPPVHQDGAWVWTRVDHASSTPIPTEAEYYSCLKGLPLRGIVAVDEATSCILGISYRVTSG
jgi:hypothetical protein